MSTLVWGPMLTAVAFLAHIALWRIRVPHRQTRCLLLLFFGTFLDMLLLTYWVHPSTRADFFMPQLLEEWILLGLFLLANALGYIITYSAVEADSPSLVLILACEDKGGLSKQDLEEYIDDQTLVLDRVDDLLRDSMAQETPHGSLIPTAKGLRFESLISGFRALLGAKKGG